MFTREAVEAEIRRLTEELAALRRNGQDEFPFQAYLVYLKDLKSHLGIARHPYISPGRKAWFKATVSSCDPSVLSRYNRLVLASLLSDSSQQLSHPDVPGDVVDLYLHWFARVLHDIREQADDYFRVDGEAFVIDLGVCCLRSIPIGGAWVVQKSRVGWGPLVGGGPLQGVRYLAAVVLKAGGFSPFYVIHTAGRYLPGFRPEEMDHAYARMAELMKRDESVRGIYRGGWLLDPGLEEVSPNLAYLRKVPEQNGAMLFRSVTVKADVRWALSMSSVRRRLHEEGKYQPTAYACIWPRKAVLAWADRRVNES